MNTVMAESHARARTVDEYEKRLQDMERHYQERMREEVRRPPHPSLSCARADPSVTLQAAESDARLNARLDILTRLQEGDRANGTPGTSSTYDDSDDEGEEEESFVSEENSEDVEEEEEQVEKMLLVDGEGDVSALAEVGAPDRYLS